MFAPNQPYLTYVYAIVFQIAMAEHYTWYFNINPWFPPTLQNSMRLCNPSLQRTHNHQSR